MHIPEADLLKVHQALLTNENLPKALELVNKALGAHATIEQIEAARDEYGSDDIEIDDDAGTSSADDGTWVQAWVWLPKEDSNADSKSV